MLYVAFHVEWSPLKICSKKGIILNNNNNNFMGFDIHYNAHSCGDVVINLNVLNTLYNHIDNIQYM
jgi:hypothetical protein